MELSIIQSKIYEIRGYKVMLDFDLAGIYGIETRVLKQSVKRNMKRFEGEDFMFELTKQEWNILRSQIVTSRWGGARYQPFSFTELGVAMLSSVHISEIYQALTELAEHKKALEEPRRRIGFKT